MLYLNVGTESRVVVTLKDRQVGLTPSYVWKIEDNTSSKQYFFQAEDWSQSPYYNGFTISVQPGATQGLTQGIVPAERGEWWYSIWEMSTPYDLDITNAVQKVEEGIMIIEGTHSSRISSNLRRDVITYKKDI